MLKHVIVGATLVALTHGAVQVWAEHGNPGQSYTFLQPPFQQNLFGVGNTGSLQSGVAFAPDGDAWLAQCLFSGGSLFRYDRQSTPPPINGTNIHTETVVPSNAGCGLANHQDGFIYSNTSLGAVQIDASTGAPTGNIFGPPGNALGIAPDPQNGDVVYMAQNCRFTGTCDIITVDPDTGIYSTFISLPGVDLINGLSFNPDGSQLLLARWLFPSSGVMVVDRVAPGARTGALNRHILFGPGTWDIRFHSSGFLVTANVDGTMSRIDLGPPDIVTVFASGGNPILNSKNVGVGPDNCIYVTQGRFTRFDDSTESSQTSLVRICSDFMPPPPLTVPFADFTIEVEIEDDEFEVEGMFTLGVVSDGIDLLIEHVTLTVGTFITTIPAGSFELDDDESFEFEGTIDGVELKVEITRLGDGAFEFEVGAEGANLNGTVNPVEVTLSMGDDAGKVSALAELNDNEGDNDEGGDDNEGDNDEGDDDNEDED